MWNPTHLPEGVTVRRNAAGIVVIRTHYSADPERNPRITPSWYLTQRKNYSSQGAWDREQEIQATAGGGEAIFREVLRKYSDKIIIRDPLWAPRPWWQKSGGFDHGKANPTATLQIYTDEEGTHYAAGEYYMPGLGPWHHAQNLKMLPAFYSTEKIYGDPNIFAATQAQSDGSFKSIATLYSEAGVKNLVKAINNAEETGMERILAHWRDLDRREPTLKIVCRMTFDKRQDGLYPYDCPNLLWELVRARRAVLTAQQMMTKNATEAIVDKDNHLRDCLKYWAFAAPQPAQLPLEQRVAGATAGMDPMNQYLQYVKLKAEQTAEESDLRITGGTALRRNVGRVLERGKKRF